MYTIKNFTDNDDINIIAQQGPFTVIEYKRDLSVTPATASTAFFSAHMNVRKRQVICDLKKANITAAIIEIDHSKIFFTKLFSILSPI